MLIAANMTTQRSIAYVIGTIAILTLVGFVIAQIRKGKAEKGAEVELAANRKPYLSDDELETTKLTGALFGSTALLGVIALSLPLYWLAEPGRQAGAVKDYQHIFEERGLELYTTGAQCNTCHSGDTKGGSATFTVTDENGNYLDTVTWLAPGLDTVLLRFSEPEVREILTYGRPGTPMPAWGVKGGGPFTDQQMDNIIDYLWEKQTPPEEFQAGVDAAVAKWDKDLAERMTALRQKNVDAGVAEPAKGERLSKADELKLGEFLFNLNEGGSTSTDAVACARCHVAGYSYGKPWEPVSEIGTGRIAPNLVGIEQSITEQQHFALIYTGSDAGKQFGTIALGSGRMPGFGVNANHDTTYDLRRFGKAGMLSPEQIWAIVSYERSMSQIPYIMDAVSRAEATPTSTTTTTTAAPGGEG
jgi:mono/diheme cytochrome c family protein